MVVVVVVVNNIWMFSYYDRLSCPGVYNTHNTAENDFRFLTSTFTSQVLGF